jgi:imidazolonepropionase-like amidohydrolase
MRFCPAVSFVRQLGVGTLLVTTLLAATIGARGVQAQDVIAIAHGKVIDGTGAAPIADGVVIIRGDRIVAVGPARSVIVPRGARVIDATGKAVLPGLTDSHVHLTGGWDGETVDLLGFRRYLDALLYCGVTTILDTGNILPYIQQVRQEVAAGRIAGPTIHMAGPVVDGADPFWPPLSIAITSVAQIPRTVRQLRRAKVDVVKGYVGLSEDQLRSLVRAAAAESLRVFVDAGGRNGTATTARSGIAAFAHLGTTPVTDETVAIMRERHVASITTLAVYESFARRRFADLTFLQQPLLKNTMPPRFVADLTAFGTRAQTGRDSADTRNADERLHVAMANAKRLWDAGVLLAAGTDSPYPGDYYGEGLHRELELLVEAGLTPLQAITSATKNAALLLEQSADWGTLEPGKRADVLVVAGDPVRHIADTRNVELVMRAGRVLDRDALRFSPTRDPGFQTTVSVTSAP